MTHYFNSPIGWLELSFSNNALKTLSFHESEIENNQNPTNDIVNQVVTQLSEYFKGVRREFSIPLSPDGTSFQNSVWEILQQVPYGQTITYGELANKLGDPKKVRAVGKANGKNPIPIIIPCHRVIGGNNKLVGYSGGIACKKHLLKHEGAILL